MTAPATLASALFEVRSQASSDGVAPDKTSERSESVAVSERRAEPRE